MRCVTQYLDNTVKRFGKKEALVDENGTLSFSDLQNEAIHVAAGVLDIAEKQPVVVFMEKCKACISAFLGIAYIGGFYVPIDVKMPEARIEKILNVLKPVCVITNKQNYDQALNIFEKSKVICYEDLISREVDTEKIRDKNKQIIDTDVLYVLFTSGSTGDPKGVIISHRAVIDYTEWVTATFEIDEKHIFGNQAPFYFDNSILDIYQMLKTGATLHIIPEEAFSFPKTMMEYLDKNKVNTIFWVPSALCFLANMRALPKQHIDSLNKILFCGEVMPNKQLNQWRREYPDALFANLYGPTEITDVCSYYIVDRTFSDDESLPIGFPCRNTDILVLDDDDKLITPLDNNVSGELCVRGTCLSYGYYNDVERTKKAFVQNPLQPAYEEKIYRTGDIVHYNEYGELEYESRKDFQIKHMGHRIELGEIETAAYAVNSIDTCCCVYDEKKKKIVMYFVGDCEDDTISEILTTKLPSYMLPGKYIKIDSMPMNLNGKIDRKELMSQL